MIFNGTLCHGNSKLIVHGIVDIFRLFFLGMKIIVFLGEEGAPKSIISPGGSVAVWL